MSIEIIREGHKPDTKLYFTCKCGCVWKADEEDCEERTVELQRDQTIKRYYYKCPTCGHNVIGLTREEYIAVRDINQIPNYILHVNVDAFGKLMKRTARKEQFKHVNMDYSNYTGSGNPSNIHKPNYDDAHFNGEFD